jgi:ketosteroid isomerase-like protein
MKTLQAQPAQGAEFPSLPAALSASDRRGISACLARDACLLTPDGTAVPGREAVCRVLAQLIAVEIRVEVESSRRLVAGDTALSRERWQVSSNGPGGTRVKGLLSPTLCLQRIEGRWKVTILVLWGWGAGLERSGD